MLKRLIGILLLVGLLTACSLNAPYPHDIEQQIKELDRTIDGRDRYEAIKKQYINRT